MTDNSLLTEEQKKLVESASTTSPVVDALPLSASFTAIKAEPSSEENPNPLIIATKE